MERIAILVDGGFYQRQAQSLWGSVSAAKRADELVSYCDRHLKWHHERDELYRIFYYDCHPSDKKVFHPLLKKQVDLAKTSLYLWKTDFLKEIISKRKVALRLGRLSDIGLNYTLTSDAVKRLCDGRLDVSSLSEENFTLNIMQKGVDTRIGMDIASLAYKRQVTRIVLISADSDFVPLVKLARREGIDVILDPMWHDVNKDLLEHVDGLRSPGSHPSAKNNVSVSRQQGKRTTQESTKEDAKPIC